MKHIIPEMAAAGNENLLHNFDIQLGFFAEKNRSFEFQSAFGAKNS